MLRYPSEDACLFMMLLKSQFFPLSGTKKKPEDISFTLRIKLKDPFLAVDTCPCLVAVDLGLERTLDGEAEVLSLRLGQDGQLSLDVVQVQLGDLLVQDLGQDVDTDIQLASLAELDILLGPGAVLVLVQGNLSKDLVGEGAGHDKGRVASGTAKVDQTALCQEDDVAAVGHGESVDLRLYILYGLGVSLQPRDVDFNVEVANVANNSIIRHNLEVGPSKNVTAASGSDEDLANGSGLLHGGDLIAGHGGLESVDGVNLSDENASAHAVQSHGAALADIAKSGDNSNLASNHDVGSALDTINERLAAAVQVVKLGLGDAVVDVDGRDEQLAVLEHAVQVVDTGGGLLGEAVAALEHLGVLGVDEGGQVTTVVEDQIELLATVESKELLLEAPVVLFLRLALPGEDGDPGGGNGGSGVVLGAEDVAAAPGNLSTKVGESLDQDSGLDGHVQAASDAGALEGLVGGILAANSNETGHLVLGELDLPAAEGGQRKVSDLEGVSGSRHGENERKRRQGSSTVVD